MASMSKPFRLVNPGRRRRKNKRLSLKQKLFFGSKKQRAAAKASLRGNRKRKHNKTVRRGKIHGVVGKHVRHAAKQNRARKKRTRKNVGSILTVFNPGAKITKRRTKKVMAHRRRHRAVMHNRRRRNTHYVRRMKRGLYQYRSNRRRRRKNPVIHHRRRLYARHNRHYSRRRNPNFLSGTAGKVVGVIGGAMVTKFLTETAGGMIPLVASGIPLYVTGAVVAFLQGKLIGKFMKNSALGTDLSVGGYTYVALKVLSDFLPSLNLPFGVSGMGLLTSSNNWGPPWQNVQSSMTRFVRPGGFAPGLPPVPVATTGVHGLGRLRRGGRLA